MPRPKNCAHATEGLYHILPLVDAEVDASRAAADFTILEESANIQSCCLVGQATNLGTDRILFNAA